MAEETLSPTSVGESSGSVEAFNLARESGGWKIRYGAEPIDLHLIDDKGKPQDPGVTMISAGPGAVFNHNYIEIMNPDGDVVKRVHGMGLDENWKMTGGGRLVGFVTDGKYTKFSDDHIQQDDPHVSKSNNLQHADVKNMIGGDYTKVVFTGTEREVLQMYGTLVRSTIEINNQDPKFGLLGQFLPNSNTFNAEMKEKLGQISKELGLEIGTHNALGIDIGSNPDMLETERATKIFCTESLPELRSKIDQLEQLAAQQLKTLCGDINADLETKPPDFCGNKM